jgi:DNA-binding CsgD family transcriptional regulator
VIVCHCRGLTDRDIAGKSRERVEAEFGPECCGGCVEHPRELNVATADEDAIEARQERAIRLRVQGFNYREIAAELGISVGTAYNDCSAAMKRIREQTRESAEEVRSVELDRLDRMIRALEVKAFGDGDTRAIDTLLKVSERRAKLLGLDAPELHVNVGEVTPDRAAQLVREAFGDHATRRAIPESEPSGETDPGAIPKHSS